jgi:hypothetical protein
MKGHISLKKVWLGLLPSMLLFSASTGLGVEPVISPGLEQGGSIAAASKGGDAETSGVTEGTPGMKVYIDPKTGEFTKPPAGVSPGEAAAPLKDALSTSSEGLEATPSPVPGGGVMIDLKGRFRTPSTATRDAEGKLTIEHQRKPSDSGEKKE